MDHQQAVEDCAAQMLRPLIDEDLSVVFYDLTTIRAVGLSQEDGDVRHFGMSKECVVARQFMLGVVQTADGMPIFHEVFDGNTAEAPTLEPRLNKVLARYPHIRRLVVVADRGLLSLDNIEALTKLQLVGQRPLEFILAVPGRRYAEIVALLQPMAAQAAQASDETVAEATWQGHRLVVAHNPVQAAEQTQDRLARIQALQQRADQLAGQHERHERQATPSGSPGRSTRG